MRIPMEETQVGYVHEHECRWSKTIDAYFYFPWEWSVTYHQDHGARLNKMTFVEFKQTYPIESRYPRSRSREYTPERAKYKVSRAGKVSRRN